MEMIMKRYFLNKTLQIETVKYVINLGAMATNDYDDSHRLNIAKRRDII